MRETVKLSSLKPDEKVIVADDYDNRVYAVQEIIDNIEDFNNETIHTTTKYYASFNAENIIEDAIECEYNNGMYEDWDENIRMYVKEEDKADLQAIFDRILERAPSQNITYLPDKIVEIDI